MPLERKTALVTGGAVGLGRSFARALGRSGAEVTIGDIRGDVEETAAQLRAEGLDVEAVVADVSRPDDVLGLVEFAAQRSGTVDVLVNNAGVVALTEPSDTWDKALDDFDYVVGSNLKGAFLCGRAVVPLMVARGEGHVVNIATDHIYTCGWPEPVDHTEAQACPWRNERRRPGWVGLDVYDASKWALNGLTQAWAKSLRQHKIRVNNICMGATDSHMQRSFLGFVDEEPPAELLAKWMDPERVAQVLIELIEEGPEGRSGDNIGLWMGHPTVLPPPSAVLNVPADLTPEAVAQVLIDAFS